MCCLAKEEAPKFTVEVNVQSGGPRFLEGISLCTDIVHEKKITGLPQIWILTLSLRNLTSIHLHQQHIKRKEN